MEARAADVLHARLRQRVNVSAGPRFRPNFCQRTRYVPLPRSGKFLRQPLVDWKIPRFVFISENLPQFAFPSGPRTHRRYLPLNENVETRSAIPPLPFATPVQ